MSQSLGQLIPVELRTVWKSEPTEFTPWLAEPENLNLLGEILGLQLDIEAVEVERPVGAFSADIVCPVINTNSLVVVENQLEKTDHDHLGKLLTYSAGLHSAGLHAVTVVWIAQKIREEHRAALDWLNEATHENFCFFGLEIELWRIGDSLVAPKFNVVAKPNDWSRATAQAARSSTKITETKRKHLDFWHGFQEVLESKRGPVRGTSKPQPQNWMNYKIGHKDFRLGASCGMNDQFISIYLYISGDNADKRLAGLEQQKTEIEEELGFSLEWGSQKETASNDRRVSTTESNTDPNDKSDRPRQYEWLAERLNKMHQVFAPRIQKLP